MAGASLGQAVAVAELDEVEPEAGEAVLEPEPEPEPAPMSVHLWVPAAFEPEDELGFELRAEPPGGAVPFAAGAPGLAETGVVAAPVVAAARLTLGVARAG